MAKKARTITKDEVRWRGQTLSEKDCINSKA